MAGQPITRARREALAQGLSLPPGVKPPPLAKRKAIAGAAWLDVQKDNLLRLQREKHERLAAEKAGQPLILPSLVEAEMDALWRAFEFDILEK